jgi:NAD(P)-dependent dehydrogenase (short-subunit alcohol dehydrogenase family)
MMVMKPAPVVLITGAAAGIGKATALAFARLGYRLILTDLKAESGPALLAEIKAAGGDARYVVADQSKEADAILAVNTAMETFGRLDVAINNAGTEGDQTLRLEQQTDANVRRTLGVNTEGVLWCLKHEIPALHRSGGGAIVNVSSVAGHIGLETCAAYVASKHAVEGLTKAAALEVARHGIRVNAVAPGAIQTDMIDRIVGSSDTDARRAIEGMHPLGRMGTPEEVAAAILFLASEEASFITGQSLAVDGGWLAR